MTFSRCARPYVGGADDRIVVSALSMPNAELCNAMPAQVARNIYCRPPHPGCRPCGACRTDIVHTIPISRTTQQIMSSPFAALTGGAAFGLPISLGFAAFVQLVRWRAAQFVRPATKAPLGQEELQAQEEQKIEEKKKNKKKGYFVFPAAALASFAIFWVIQNGRGAIQAWPAVGLAMYYAFMMVGSCTENFGPPG
jgi:hypothetical protein